ncbi:MAG TPA: exopolysaccharide biosynthesis polyprenyl glycosylphosphotransferase [Caulobacteraceae bacterium]|nr:exopolysaccharide biosynthesis polyprenyl glycosylphosphotransferase [Caulobacteraceae bacterium]
MSATLLRTPQPSQAETRTPAPPRRLAQIGAGRGGGGERRGPMRPVTLAPSRARLTGWTLAMIFRAADAGALALAALGAAWLASPAMDAAALTPFAAAALTLVWSLSALRAYAFVQGEALRRHLVRVAAGFGLAALVLEVLLGGFRPTSVTPAQLGAWLGASFLGLFLLHGLWWANVRRWRAMGRLTPNIVVVGATPSAEKLIRAAIASGEAAVLGVFDDRAGRIAADIAGVPVLGDTAALMRHRIMPCIDKVVIAVPTRAHSRIEELIARLSALPNEVTLFVDQGAAGRAAALSRIAEAPLAPVSGAPSDERRALVKRAADLLLGSLALILGLPLMLALAAAIKLDSPGPVFFRQRRHGFNNEEILVWKLRSMRADCADESGVRQVACGDARVTRVGRFIRRTSLDELPQLVNVLRGEMSLVGPRPHAVGMRTGATESAKLVAGYAHRHRMKPGMTGWAAVNGSRGPVDTAEAVRRRVVLDIEYIERQSLGLDLKIMLATIPCLLGDSRTVR